MKTLVIVLIIASFLQSTILPLNLVLIILIARALIRPEKANLFLAFAMGFLVSHLNLVPLGWQSLTFLSLVKLAQILSKSRVSANPLVIAPLVFVLLSFNQISNAFALNQSIKLLPQVLLESLLSLPIFYLVRLWEERFIVRKEIKLKVGQN